MRTLRPARPEDAEAISALALRSKAHWPYSDEQMAVFRLELVLSPEHLMRSNAHVIEEAGRLLGFYTLSQVDDRCTELEHIFVEPAFLGEGIGRALFRHACSAAAGCGALVLIVRSDPHAAGFYRALGGEFTGEIDSSIPGRKIPTFRWLLPTTAMES
ncbi:MAG: GNAT family N-acetyltransferase [Deltaproteobacteria bacterium]|nr:GNAT family N-acetyltransferase [Deltaproteobacteria bacterium]